MTCHFLMLICYVTLILHTIRSHKSRWRPIIQKRVPYLFLTFQNLQFDTKHDYVQNVFNDDLDHLRGAWPWQCHISNVNTIVIFHPISKRSTFLCLSQWALSFALVIFNIYIKLKIDLSWPLDDPGDLFASSDFGKLYVMWLRNVCRTRW